MTGSDGNNSISAEARSALSGLMGKALVDPSFMTKLLNDPTKALDEIGLTEVERSSLAHLDRDRLKAAAELLESSLQNSAMHSSNHTSMHGSN